MAGKATLLTAMTAADSVETDPDLRRGYLKSATQQSRTTVELTIEDAETGQLTSVTTDHLTAMLGANRKHIPPEYYEEASGSPSDPYDLEQVAHVLLDTRGDGPYGDSGVTFYYNANHATPDPRDASQ